MPDGKLKTVRLAFGAAISGCAHLFVAANLLFCSSLAFANEVDEAIAVVEQLQAALLEVAAIEPAPDLAFRYEVLAPVVRETHDLTMMGRLTVRRFWRSWSEAERESFIAVFERLSITTYARRFAAIGPGAFEVTGGKPIGENRIAVDALIHRRDNDDVLLDYTLQLDGTRWSIVNIVADGASELSLMAAEYYDVLESGSLDDLIAELETQITDL